ncbi:MAG: hypothetical protein GZ086_00425 [Gelidibacter sp.]|nr:hypothetical protein [Gelidibacter sp.]
MNNFMKNLTLVFLLCIGFINAQEKISTKKVYIPAKVWRVPEKNNYEDAESDYSYSRMIESDNIAMFWNKEYGNDPMTNADSTKRFDPKKVIVECERFYNFYVNDLKLVQKGSSISDKCKLLIYIFGGDENTAFGGGGGGEKVGILWTPAKRINKPPYGALAHEIGHSFQYMSRTDSKKGPRGPVMEMSAQYMLWQVYPEWMTFENYHLKDFLKGTHYAFLHPYNMYHSPYVLEYWSNKHGIEFWGNLCRSTQKGEDVVMTYKRMNNITQEQFNDEMFDASRKFISWDLKRIENVAKPYRNMHKTTLHLVDNGWYQIDSINCPQNYGYNGIKLNVPKSGTKINVNFKGIPGAKGYSAVKTDKAFWRYGFLASLKDGSRTYGAMYKDANDAATFKVPENTAYLWLVVSGAPKEHIHHDWEDKLECENFPYKVQFENTKHL